MRWLFVVGVGLEISGALLVVGSLLLPVVRRQWAEIAARGYLFPRGGPQLDDMLEPAYAAAGAVLLVGGFGMQLAGYVVEFHGDALIAAGAATAVGGLLVGLLVARYVVANALLRRALAHNPTEERPGA